MAKRSCNHPVTSRLELKRNSSSDALLPLSTRSRMVTRRQGRLVRFLEVAPSGSSFTPTTKSWSKVSFPHWGVSFRLHKCHRQSYIRAPRPTSRLTSWKLSRTHTGEKTRPSVRLDRVWCMHGLVISRPTISPEKEVKERTFGETAGGDRVWLHVPTEYGCITRNARPVLGGQRKLESQLAINTFRACFSSGTRRGINRWANPRSLSQSTV